MGPKIRVSEIVKTWENVYPKWTILRALHLININPVEISGTVVGENPDCLLLSGTVVGENPDHVCWEVHFKGHQISLQS